MCMWRHTTRSIDRIVEHENAEYEVRSEKCWKEKRRMAHRDGWRVTGQIENAHWRKASVVENGISKR